MAKLDSQYYTVCLLSFCRFKVRHLSHLIPEMCMSTYCFRYSDTHSKVIDQHHLVRAWGEGQGRRRALRCSLPGVCCCRMMEAQWEIIRDTYTYSASTPHTHTPRSVTSLVWWAQYNFIFIQRLVHTRVHWPQSGTTPARAAWKYWGCHHSNCICISFSE